MLRAIRNYVHRIALRWVEHDNVTHAAAIAFYTIFSLAPTLVLGVAAVRWFLDDEQARAAAIDSIEYFITTDGAKLVDTILSSIDLGNAGLLATLVSIAVMLFAASSVFTQLRATLNLIMGVSYETTAAQVAAYFRGRLIATVFVVGIGVVMLTSLAANAMIAALSRVVSERLGMDPGSLSIANQIVSASLAFAGFVCLLKFLPAANVRLIHILPGALLSTALFELGKYLLTLYVAHSITTSAYGASASVVVVIIWVYYSAQIFLLGAEITGELHERRLAKLANAASTKQ